MSKLNKDILFLLFEELQDDSKSLFSCLLVNRLWCETVVPILWENPWRFDINYQNMRNDTSYIAWFNTIIEHNPRRFIRHLTNANHLATWHSQNRSEKWDQI